MHRRIVDAFHVPTADTANNKQEVSCVRSLAVVQDSKMRQRTI
jgi:hypothetical protein